MRLLHPLPSKRKVWAEAAVDNWRPFLSRPDPSKFGEFLKWLWQLASSSDISTLYLAMVCSWLSISPPEAKGASRCTLRSRTFAVIHLALSCARLSAARHSTKWPKWFQCVWKSLPPSCMQGVSTMSFEWFLSVVRLINGQSPGTSIYLLFGHSGLYIGKANIHRRSPGGQAIPGIPARLVEHMVALTFPKSRDGSLARYAALRPAFASVSFLPVFSCPSEDRALAIERALISAMKPNCNRADWTAVASTKRLGTLLCPSKVARARPPPPIRGVKSPKTSVWIDLHFEKQHKKQKPTSTDLALESIPRYPFGRLYRWLQDRELARTGLHGPLPLFGMGMVALFLAFVASRSPRLHFPRSWSPGDVANQIYKAAVFVEKALSSIGLRIAARRTMEKALGAYGLPPLCVRPLVLPAFLLPRLRMVRQAVFAALCQVKNRQARKWLSDNVRVFPSKVHRWKSRVNAKSVLSRTCLSDLHRFSKDELSRMCTMPSLRACHAQWRLPIWPTRARVRGLLRGAWNTWAQSHRLPFASIRLGNRRMAVGLDDANVDLPPLRWQQFEEELEQVVAGSPCIIHDDKLASKAWSCNPLEFFASLLASLAEDPLWSIHSELSVEDVKAASYAKALLGIPSYLRSRAPKHRDPEVPKLFAFVKSKCFTDTGEKVCRKPGHSCCRRVVDTASVAFSSAWKVLGRAARAVVESLGGSEIFDQSRAGTKLQEMLEGLAPPCSSCKVCGSCLNGNVSLFSADVDQAFESCEGSNVSKAWQWAAQSFTATHSTQYVQIRRGRKYESRLGSRPWNRGWWVLHLRDIGKALLAAVSATLVVLGSTVLQLHGMTIGGSMSSSAVAVRFAQEESQAFVCPAHVQADFHKLQRSDIRWLRYVDDLLSASRTVCASCLQRFFQLLYSEPLSVVFSSDVTPDQPCVWLHFELYLRGPVVVWMLKTAIAHICMVTFLCRLCHRSCCGQAPSHVTLSISAAS